MAYVNGRKVLQVVRTRYLNLDDVYPVGSIYISVGSTSPASLFGGVWELMQNKFLLGTDDLANLGATGGEATHQLTATELPSHRHQIYTSDNTGTGYGDSIDHTTIANGTFGTLGLTRWMNFADTLIGSDYNPITANQPHNNMPPYIKVAIWKRIADPQEE